MFLILKMHFFFYPKGYHNKEKFGSYLEYMRAKRPTPNLVNCGYFTPKRVQTASAISNRQEYYLESIEFEDDN